MRSKIKVLTSARSSATRRWSDFSDRDDVFGSLLRGIMEPNALPYFVSVKIVFKDSCGAADGSSEGGVSMMLEI
tara:strand:- start:448 stop:669 length:222 start_codon:yes stop_codon:yes gene_type:complete